MIFAARASRHHGTGAAVVCALFLTSVSAVAQNPGAQDVDRILPAAPPGQLEQPVTPQGENQGYAAMSPNDEDLGQQQILKRQEQYQPFTVSLSTPFFYTSNVALVRRGARGDLVAAPEIGINYMPRLTKTLYADFAIRQQFFLYNRFDELNFASLEIDAGLVYYLPQVHNLTLRAHYSYNRLTDTDHFDEFYSNHTVDLNVELPFRIGRAQQISLGVDATISLYARPELPRRNDYDFYVGYSVHLSRSFSLDAVARLAVRDYHETDRVDVSEILALSANYRVRDWLTVSAISTFAANQSNHSVFDYNVLNIGGGVGVSIKF
jgi:hypothetical protein